MKSIYQTLFPLLLASFAACARQDEVTAFYAPTEPGMTLQFESIETNDRLQMRVERTTQTAEGLVVVCSVSTLQGTLSTNFVCKQDGEILVGPVDNRSIVLPSGFPNRTAFWQTDLKNYQVLGRAKAKLPGVELKHPIGVWIEVSPSVPHSPKSANKVRMFLLPGIGEAENQELRQGTWVTVNRIVGIGISEVPR
jgi:hypothetical protein